MKKKFGKHIDLIALLLSLTVLFALLFGLILPLRDELYRKRLEIEKRELLKELRNQKTVKNIFWQRDVERIRANAASLDVFPDRDQVVDIIRELETAAEKVGMEVEFFVPKRKRGDGKEKKETLALSLRGRGDFPAALAMIELLENYRFAIDIDKMTLSAVREDSRVVRGLPLPGENPAETEGEDPAASEKIVLEADIIFQIKK
ncbi:MAG TPA: hypothetical protein ENJ77_00295 [Candidatus Moranbacteria bacterium]|nr:hypothetical protein [Candidatus Moranbacteria bacterium]